MLQRPGRLEDAGGDGSSRTGGASVHLHDLHAGVSAVALQTGQTG